MNTASPVLSSGLNPHFKDYRFENVYLRTTETQRSEILTLWRNERAGIQDANAERSSREAVFLIRACSGELVGGAIWSKGEVEVEPLIFTRLLCSAVAGMCFGAPSQWM